MVCVYCAHNTTVINSRKQRNTNQIWRRRLCNSCKSVFTTYESIDYSRSFVVQKTGKEIIPFMRDQLFLSIFKCCRHRQTALEDAIGLTNTVAERTTRLLAHNGLISNASIAKTCVDVLEKFDTAAAIQYKAYHNATLGSLV
jgi:transcriptional repressor NrdR